MHIRSLFLLLFAVPMIGTAQAPVSRDQLLAMVDAGAAPELMVSVVERDCVDFDVDAATLVQLTPRVPQVVLEAAMRCRGNATTPESFTCRIYRALTQDPILADFPVILDDNHKGRLALLEPDPDVWHLETSDGRGFKARFKSLRAHTVRHIAASEAVNGVPGVRDFTFLREDSLSVDELAAMQQRAILDACAVRATVTFTSDPAEAQLYVDDEYLGTTPMDLEVLPGDRAIRIERDTFAPYTETIRLADGEVRAITAVLEPLARVRVDSDPVGAIVTVNDDFVGHAPLDFFVDTGEHTLRVVAAGHLPFETTLDVQRGEEGTVPAQLEAATPDAHCHVEPTEGNVASGVKTLARRLRGTSLTQLVPIYRVVSESDREQSATHVVDGRQLLFEPQAGDRYVDSPWKLVGRDLAGMGFGETAVDVRASRPGRVTVKGLDRRKSTIIVETLHEDGATNKVYFDFTQPLDQLPVSTLFEAMCLVFARYPAP